MKNSKLHANSSSPWAWIPSLYFAEGIPNVVAVTVSVIMFKRLGLSNTDIALYTSWLTLPWVLKPFWGPLVDLVKTKRWWIILMQLFIGAALGGIGLSLPLPIYFKASLIFMWLLAFSSATHDIAADGFYMLALEEHKQAYFVGIRSTFYRLAMITGNGLLIILAGMLEVFTGLPPVEVEIGTALSPRTELLPTTLPPADVATAEKAFFWVDQERVTLSTQPITAQQLDSIKVQINSYNRLNRFITSDITATETTQESGWKRHVSGPLGAWLRQHFKPQVEVESDQLVGNVARIGIQLSRPLEQDEQMVLNARMLKEKDIRIIAGERLLFDRHNSSQKAYLLVQLDKKATTAHDTLSINSGNVQLAWSILFFILAGGFTLLFLYHRYILPRPDSDTASSTEGGTLEAFFHTFATFFTRKDILLILSFLLLYRFAEAQLLKIATPFLLDARSAGGLALTTSQLGVVYGTVGVVMLTLGGIVGGIVAAKKGLRFWLWPMAILMNLPNAVYIYMATTRPTELWIVGSCIAIEQFCYGFAFTAYMLYMMYVCQKSGAYKTAHYALCTGFMALGIMLPGMGAGWIQEQIGYTNFFIWVLICALPAVLPLLFVKVEAKFGKK